MLFSPRTLEPDTPKPGCKRTSKKIHFIRQNVINAIRHVPPLSKSSERARNRSGRSQPSKKIHNENGTNGL